MESPAGRPVLAVDLGGTQIRAALITPDLAVHARRAVRTRDEEGVDAVLERIARAAIEVRDEVAKSSLPPPIGIGISAPGPLDPRSGIVIDAPNLAGWENVPLAQRIEDAVGLPAILERDTNAAVMAEWRYGAARGTSTAVYVTVSTGIGGGVIVEGLPLIGPHGTAGEVGHLTVELDGPTCGCGGIGHVEAIASGTAIARDAAGLLERHEAPRLAAIAADGTEVDAAAVARAADEGDEACIALLDRAWRAIGAMCASLVNLLDPEVIVLGGSIAQHRSRLFEVVRTEIDSRSFGFLASRVRVERAQLGGDVSLIGLLPITNDRIGDPDRQRGSHRPRTAALEQGALRS